MDSRPNVLLLVADSLRSDVVWSDDTATPTIDRLAAADVVFSQCVAQGISTAPAMTALLTGRLPLDYGGHWYLDDDQPTFAGEFQRAGYRTGAVHSNPYVSSRRNFDRGFDVFDEDVVAFEPDRSLERAPEKLLRLLSRLSRIVNKTPYTPADTINEKIIDFVDEGDRPWFSWAQYMDAHGPYLPGGDFSYPDKFRAELLWRKAAVTSPDDVTDAEREALWRNYRLEVEYLDEQIGVLLDALESHDELSNTIIVLTADHGDEFYEHGRYGHGNLPYDELVCVPLVIRFPDGSLGEPVTIDSMVRSVDILPTVLDAVEADLSHTMRERMVGTSLLPLIDTPDVDIGIDHAVTEKRVRGTDALRIGFRTDRWKFLYDGQTDKSLLFDLIQDPDEQTDVSGSEPDILKHFQNDLQSRLDRLKHTSADIEIPDFETDVRVEERLRVLGYRD